LSFALFSISFDTIITIITIALTPAILLQVSFRDPPLPASSAFVTATTALGFEHGDYNGAARASAHKGVVGHHQFTIREGHRESTYTAFIKPAMSRANLTVSV
jgi:choline dehydrogenase